MTGLETALLGIVTAGLGASGGFIFGGRTKVSKSEFDLRCGYQDKDLKEIKAGIVALQRGQEESLQRLVKLETRMASMNGKE